MLKAVWQQAAKGTDFLSDAGALTHFVFEAPPRPTSVDARWLFHCFSLESFTLQQLSHLCCQCVSLETATFHSLPLLETVKEGWMNECPILSAIHFDRVPNLVMTPWTAGWGAEVDVSVSSTCHKTLQDVATRKPDRE